MRAAATITSTLLCSLAIVVVPRTSAAQPAERADPQPAIVPPRPLSSTDVEYPAGARGEAVVTLHLVVSRDGSVAEVVVIVGTEPFASAAREAAKTWKFEPATRAGAPIVARIRYEVRFREPEKPPPPVSDAVPPTPQPRPTSGETPPKSDERDGPRKATQPKRRSDEPIDVTIVGEKLAPGATSMTRAEVRQLPGAFGDPFRAIEALPGVTPMISGAPFFFVRGAPPGDVGYYLDGIRIPLLYHVALGPAVIHPGLIEQVELHPGGYPARFGRFAGGIVAAKTTDPRPELHGEGNIRLFDTGALIEGPFANGRGTALVGGRYSYTAAILSLISPEISLQYWDYQGRATYSVGRNDTLSVFAFGAFDYLGEEQENGQTETLAATEFHRLDLRHDRDLGPGSQMRTAITLGLDRTRGDEDDTFVRDRMLGVRTEIRHRLDEGATLSVGTDAVLDTYDVQFPPADEPLPEPLPPGTNVAVEDDDDRLRRIFPERQDVVLGAYGGLTLEVAPRVTVMPGVRVDFYGSDGATALGIDPRLSARFDVTKTVHLIHALGLAHQPPSFVVPIPGFQIGGLRNGLQLGVQTSSGVQVDLPEDTTASFTVFQNAVLNMTDAIGLARTEGGDFDNNFETRSMGRTIGLEVFLRRRLTQRLGGYIAYTLSRSTRSFRTVSSPSSFDRTHVLNLAAAYNLGRRWRAGTRFTFYTGFPATIGGFEAAFTNIEAERSPPFYRVDVRLEKRWPIGTQGAWWAVVFEVLNTTLHKEVVEYTCRIDGCESRDIGPVTIPSIGVEAAF